MSHHRLARSAAQKDRVIKPKRARNRRFSLASAGYCGGIAALLAASLLLVAARPGHAQEAAGATYVGTHPGGTLAFDVSPDGTKVTSFRATKIRGDNCTLDRVESNYAPGQGLPIDNHAFAGPAPPFWVEGAFSSTSSAQGTFDFAGARGPRGCRVDDVPWSAIVDPSAPALALRLGGSAKQSVKQGSLRVVVHCPDETCGARARGTVNVPGASAGRRFKLAEDKAFISWGSNATLTLRIPYQAQRVIKHALREDKGVAATVTVTARDLVGNTAVGKRTIRLVYGAAR
jgi:hypothetical protein